MAAKRRGRKLWFGGIGSLVLVVIVAVVVVVATGSPQPSHTSVPATVNTVPFSPAETTGLSSSAPPWSRPQNAAGYISNAGLTVAGTEATTVHYHAHLDIIDNGSAVTVPAGIGFVVNGGRVHAVSSLHPHDTSGVVHIESPTHTSYTLGSQPHRSVVNERDFRVRHPIGLSFVDETTPVLSTPLGRVPTKLSSPGR
jgi:hypothetical protein